MTFSHSVARKVVGGSTTQNPTGLQRQQQMSGDMPILQRAVVVEVIDDISQYTEEELQRLAGSVNNPDIVDILPTNSIVARIISDSSDTGNPQQTILFPFFATYMQLPICPGEQVSVIYGDPSKSGVTTGYWLSRISEARTVEDVNYNVHDRRFLPEYNPQLLTTSERGSQENQQTPSFPNGANTEQTYTLRVTGSNNQNPYDGIVEQSKSIKNFTFEPVPRYKKRVGEFVLQGKNNSMIVLGEDRSSSVQRTEQDAADGFAGSLDLVAGRGRKLPATDSEEPEEGAPRIITNSRSQREVNKTPYLNEGTQDNPTEGNQSFTSDAARVLISMQSEVDVSFTLEEQPFADDTLPFEQPKKGETGIGKSYVIAKADHIRLVSRKTDEVEGTVLVVREGASEEELCYLHFNNEGKMQLWAPEIYMGKATGKAEPYIKWSEYKTSIEKLQEQIDALKSFCQSTTTTLTTAFGAAIAIPYSPITGLSSQVPSIRSNFATLQGNLDQPSQDALQAVENSKSTRIFGE